MSEAAERRVAAAIDIGTNSIKLTVARQDERDGVEQIDWATTPVLLGRGLELTGRLDDDRVAAALETLEQYAARARELGAGRIVAVATEATRAAENGAEFLERVRRETGIEVRVIDGQEEAALTFRGLAATHDLSGPVVIADIGGGSTEVIAAEDGRVLEARSLVLGSARLTDRLVQSDPPGVEEVAACQDEASAVLATLDHTFTLPRGPGLRLLILGGTGEYLHRLIEPDREIDLPTVRQIQARLMAKSAADLAAEAGIPEPRARVLPAGAAIVAALAMRFAPERIEIARSGIRTGLLLEMFEAANPDATPSTEGDVPVESGSAEQESFREAMRSLIAERWDTVWRTIPAAIEGVDIEAVHDVRVASRRLRAAMDVGVDCFPGKWYRPLHRAAKEITGALGEVRDRDVLLAALRDDREKAPITEHPGLDRLISRVERERTAAREEMESYLRALLAGPLRGDVERRFGSRDAAKVRQKV
jgi:exopolyphosphatase/pppGpp-phosphohydrolase